MIIFVYQTFTYNHNTFFVHLILLIMSHIMVCDIDDYMV